VVGRAKKYDARSLKHRTGSRCVRDSDAYRDPSKGEHNEATSRTWRVNGRRGRVARVAGHRRRAAGQGLERFTVECAEGTITVVGTPGDSASRWIDDQHMVLLSITFSPGGVVIKAYGQKTGLAANAVSCTVTDPLGMVTVLRAPVPPPKG
jgi:hypothetical protein